MQKREFMELFEAALRAAKSVKGDENPPEVSRFVDAMNRLKEAPKSLVCDVVCKTSMGQGLEFFIDHKNPKIRSEGRILRDLCNNREAAVKIPTHATMKKTGDSKRDKVREILQTSLAKVASEVVDTEMKTRVTACDPWVVAVSVETAMFENLGCFMGPQKAKYRSILFNMGDSNNPDLRRKVLLGEISGERLVKMEKEEMGSSWYTNSRRNPLYESTHYTDFRFPQIKAHLWHKVRVFSLFTYILERTKRSFT
ncbi:putative transcription elongation factor, TFIIS/CRSP70, sub-type [Arabidopsis thaliana]